MATTVHSRMNFMNLRERRTQAAQEDTSIATIVRGETHQNENKFFEIEQPKLVIPEPSYEPTNPFTNSRTSMRILKGKVDRGAGSIEKEKNPQWLQEAKNGFLAAPQSQMNHTFKPKQQEKKIEQPEWNVPLPPRPVQNMAGLKLVLPDEEPQLPEKKPPQVAQLSTSKEGFAKRIIVEPPKENKPQPAVVQPTPLPMPTLRSEACSQQTKVEEPKKQPIPPTPPTQQPQIQNENELVECPEGCGRKFNRKALETHAKACKIVFMSKRKQFNSQAKRVTNKQQANLVKQAKQKEKKELASTKLQKTGEAWKTQSEGFRAVVKALKQQDVKVEEQDVKVVACEFCEKKFNEILYSKHLVICEVKKQKERKVTKKTTKKQS